MADNLIKFYSKLSKHKHDLEKFRTWINRVLDKPTPLNPADKKRLKKAINKITTHFIDEVYDIADQG